MKCLDLRLSRLLCLLWVVSSCPSVAMLISPNVELRALGKGAYVVNLTENSYIEKGKRISYQANSLLVITRNPKGAILVDSPSRKVDAKALIQWLREAGIRQMTVINSHSHLDATGSNDVFKRAGATVIASTLTKQRLIKKNRKALAPTKLFQLADVSEETLYGEKVELHFKGHSHAPDNIVVYFPDRKLLFGSCLVKSGLSLGNLEDANLESWLKVVRKIQDIKATKVIPGHGHSETRNSLSNTQALLEKALRLTPKS